MQNLNKDFIMLNYWFFFYLLPDLLMGLNPISVPLDPPLLVKGSKTNMLLSSPRFFVSAVHFWCFEVLYDRSEPFNVIRISKTTRRPNFTFFEIFFTIFKRFLKISFWYEQFFNSDFTVQTLFIHCSDFKNRLKIVKKFQKM